MTTSITGFSDSVSQFYSSSVYHHQRSTAAFGVSRHLRRATHQRTQNRHIKLLKNATMIEGANNMVLLRESLPLLFAILESLVLSLPIEHGK